MPLTKRTAPSNIKRVLDQKSSIYASMNAGTVDVSIKQRPEPVKKAESKPYQPRKKGANLEQRNRSAVKQPSVLKAEEEENPPEPQNENEKIKEPPPAEEKQKSPPDPPNEKSERPSPQTQTEITEIPVGNAFNKPETPDLIPFEKLEASESVDRPSSVERMYIEQSETDAKSAIEEFERAFENVAQKTSRGNSHVQSINERSALHHSEMQKNDASTLHNEISAAGRSQLSRPEQSASLSVNKAKMRFFKNNQPSIFNENRNINITKDAKKFLLGFSDDRIQMALQAYKNGAVTTDLRQIESAIFVASINNEVTDYHKAFIGSDLSSSMPHYLWISLWAMLLGCAITLLIVFGYIKMVLNILSYMFYFFISLEYILMFAAMKTGQYPPKPEVTENSQTIVQNHKICLIIPVGWGIKGLNEQEKADKREGKIDVLTNTIDAANTVFNPQDIFIFHNSSDQELPDEVMYKCCENRAVYVPISMGSKSISAYYGALFGKDLGYDYCIVMDDDTRLPKELGIVLNQDLKDDAYCFAIAASSNDDLSTIGNEARLLIGLQDIEYKLSDLAKLTESNWTNTASVLAPHGAINMWKTSLLTEVMNEHNCIFHGEDYQMGLIMRMKWPKSRLGIISNCIINTVAPSTLHDLYMQRYTSWDLAAEEFLWGGFCASQRSAHYMQVLFCLPCSIDNIYIRVTALEDIWTVMQDYLRVILLSYHIIFSIAYGILNIPVLVMYLVVIGSEWVIAYALEYVKFGKKRPDLAVEPAMRMKTVLLFPIYRFCFSFVRVAALCRFLLKYESIKRNATPIRHMNLPEPQLIDGLFPGNTEQADSKQTLDIGHIQHIINMTLESVPARQPRNFVAGSYLNNDRDVQRSMRSRLSIHELNELNKSNLAPQLQPQPTPAVEEPKQDE